MKKIAKGKIKFGQELKNEFNTFGLVLIPVAIAINWVGAYFAQLLKLPIWLDTIGTMISAILVGPWNAAIAGALTNLIKWITFDPVAGPYAITNAAIGITLGMLYRKGWFSAKPTVSQIIKSGIIIAVVATVISAPITVYMFGGVTGGGVDLITAMLLGTGGMGGLLTAVFSSELIGDLLDKLISLVVVGVIIENIPKKYFKQ